MQQDVTKVHLLSLTHTQTLTNTKRTPHTFSQISLCTYMLLGLSTVWSTNRTGIIQNARSQVFDVSRAGNEEVKVAAGELNEKENTEYCSETQLMCC